MTFEKLSCKGLVEDFENKLKLRIDECTEKFRAPSLAVILVGENPASHTYVKKKKESCEKLGITHTQITFPEDISEDVLINKIEDLNKDESIDGILVQLPLPNHINETRVINSIRVDKDVDGFSPENVGKMMLGQECFLPCTPAGVLEIIKYFNIDTVGKNVTIFGRSNIVGRPMANLLSQKPYDANVTVFHSKSPTNDVLYNLRDSDIIILAVGSPDFFDYKKLNSLLYYNYRNNMTIIDVGVNRVPDPTKKSGFRLCGDLSISDLNDKEEILKDSMQERTLRYTPVPGGVGLTTVMMLMNNTLEACIRHSGVTYGK